LTCKKAIRQLSEYLDGELEATLAQELERHLEGCHDCRLIVDTTRKTIEIYCHSEPLPLPEPVRERLMRALASKCFGKK
jgi:anti-sigma factor RsiW